MRPSHQFRLLTLSARSVIMMHRPTITGDTMIKNRNHVIILLVALLALNWFDAWATSISLQNGAEEVNPITLHFIEQWGIISIVSIKTALILPLFHRKCVDAIVQSTICSTAVVSVTIVYWILAGWHIIVFHMLGFF